VFSGPDWFDLVLFYVMMAVVWVGIPVSIFAFARRFLRAYERRAAAPAELAELRAEILELQGQVADLAIENDRLREPPRLAHRLPRENDG
jgi:hypothetical protein